jgi:hypothetical protein
MSGSAPIQREITSPMTVELSTTMTCKGFRLVELGTCGPANTTVVLHRGITEGTTKNTEGGAANGSKAIR